MPLLGSLGIDVTVNPRETTVSTILQHIRRGKIHGVHTIHDGVAEIIEAEATESSPLIGRRVDMLNLPDGVLLGAILRKEEMIVPEPETTIQLNDHIIIVALTQMVKKVEQIFSTSNEIF